MKNNVAKILVASQAQSLDRLFDYSIPEEFQPFLQVGARVIVPFQNRPNLGYVWGLTDDSVYENLKKIQQVLDDPPLINQEQYQLINWLADYYFCNRTEAVKLCLPPGANLSREAYCRIKVELIELEPVLNAVFSPAEVSVAIQIIATGANNHWNENQWQKKFNGLPLIWEFLNKQKIIERTYGIAEPKIKQKVVKVFRWVTDAGEDRSATGGRVKKVLSAKSFGMSASELCATAEVSSTVLKRLHKEGKIACFEVEEERSPSGFDEQFISKEIYLNMEQQAVFKAFSDQNNGKLYLLHGITGSGKTEVYFEAAAEVINQGGQVLYLVPEISLTPQTLERARNRFGDQVALLHSNMSDGERYDQWFRVKNGRARFILGARSAVFAPFNKLGLIIIDEEHETTYKQEENPRYHIRQVVEKLALITGAKVIFGSATPSIESFYYTKSGKYFYLQLKERFNRNPLPEVVVVDMRDELHQGNKNILSRLLFNSIAESLARKEQIILLLNRRGHSTFILCRDCGQSLRCPACEVALTYHLSEKTLRCHYCDYRQPVPDTCPNCKGVRIRYFGHGTQKLEEELKANFPTARTVRMDVDSTSKKGSHQQIYRQLTTGAVDILLGTQMIAKGLDLPGVTLVGVISADSPLNIPDFRAAERTFQLLTQVAGRTGRGQETGRVIFQTYDPDHYAIGFAKNHDYQSFYQTEIGFRESLRYPPYTELVKVGFSGLNQQKVSDAAYSFYQIVKVIQESLAGSGDSNYDIDVLGPAPTLIAKVQNNYRWQLLVKSSNHNYLEQLIKEAWQKYQLKKFPDVKVIKDRNPYLVV